MRPQTAFLAAAASGLGGLLALSHTLRAADTLRTADSMRSVRPDTTDVRTWTLVSAAGIAGALLLFVVGRTAQERAKGLQDDLALFGPLDVHELGEREQFLRLAAGEHWRKFLKGAVAIAVGAVVLALLSGDNQGQIVGGAWMGLALGSVGLFFRWVNAWRFVVKNRQVVGETDRHYDVAPRWRPRRLRLL